MNSALYTGTVMHAREAPTENVFRYPVCFYLIDLDELPRLDRSLHLFGYGGRNLVTLRDDDHLGDPRRPIRDNVLSFLSANGIDLMGGRIELLTNLRVAGYVFNPVSFFYCYGSDGTFECVIAEVNNTFGERYPYLLRPENEVTCGRYRSYFAEKKLHVSPFFPMNQTYTLSFSEPAKRVHARIDLHEDGQRLFRATLSGERQSLNNKTLVRALARYPLMPVQVIGLIHWQAVKLFFKGVPFHGKPDFVPGEGSVKA